MPGRKLTGALALGVIAAAQVGVAGAAQAPLAQLPQRGHVADTVRLPATQAEAQQLGRDVDGDGHVDNLLGGALAAFNGQGFEPAAVQSAIDNGDIVMLHSLRTTSVADSTNATWQVWYDAPTPDPDLSGSGTFELSVDRPHSKRLAATISDHQVTTAPGAIPVRLDIGAGVFRLRLTQAVVDATCHRRGCSAGRITGAVGEEQIQKKLFRELAELFQIVVSRDCPGPGPDSCTGTGTNVQSLFDTNDDLVITRAELRSNSLLQTVLSPDLDLFEADGTPGQDGINDAVSFGLGFKTARATLVGP